MISVIVITYNQENSIARTLESILCQRCGTEVEIVVGEDGSSDNTRAICEEYARRYPDKIRLMPKAPNKGVVDNYFDCLLACRGEYIADCAGDDYWIDGLKLQKEWEVLESDRRITIVHTAYTTSMASGGDCMPEMTAAEQYGRVIVTDGKDMLEAIITQTRRPVIHLCTALYRKDVLMGAYEADTFLFRNREFGCEDLQICCAMAAAGSVAYLPDCTLCYSVGAETVSFSLNDRKQFVFKRRTGDLSHYLARKYGIGSRAADSFFSLRLFALLMHAFRANDSSLRQEALDCRRRWGARLTLASVVVLAATANAATWSLALCLRKYFLKLKPHGSGRAQ